MKSIYREAIEDCPVIAAVKDQEGLDQCLTTDSRIIFVLYGDVLNIADIVARIKESGRIAVVHIDLIAGLSAKEVSVDFIHTQTQADGIISTKPALIKHAKALGMLTIFRFFVIDSMAYENIRKQCTLAKPDCIEVLPGVMPKVIRRICASEHVPVIAGGLIEDKEDIMHALEAGAVSISTTNHDVWFM